MKKLFLLILGVGFLVTGKAQTVTSSEIVIKSLVPKGSVTINEFGNHSDWLELYNTTEKDIDLSDGNYYISDNPNRPRKFKLKKGIIPAKESIIIWCDDEGRFKNQIHTNFKLSSSGETLTVSRFEGRNKIILDQISYDALGEDSQLMLTRDSDTFKLMRLVNCNDEFSLHH